jgi:hypothetical protein
LHSPITRDVHNAFAVMGLRFHRVPVCRYGSQYLRLKRLLVMKHQDYVQARGTTMRTCFPHLHLVVMATRSAARQLCPRSVSARTIGGGDVRKLARTIGGGDVRKLARTIGGGDVRKLARTIGGGDVRKLARKATLVVTVAWPHHRWS